MTELKPILDGAEVRSYKGRYNVQLEIPDCSTLTENEIGRILAVSSWDTDPSSAADGCEGGRDILLKRESPIHKGEVELPLLQVSGIGYRKINFVSEKVHVLDGNSEFFPPSQDNFMDNLKGTLMTTSYEKEAR